MASGLPSRTADQHDIYGFGASNSLLITKLFGDLENYPAIYGMETGNYYRGDNMVRKPGSEKEQKVDVIEVLRSSKKQILWIWSYDLDKFTGKQLRKLKKTTRTTETELFYRTWEHAWTEIAKAGETELEGVVRQIPRLNISAKQLFREEKNGINLVVVYLEDNTLTPYELMMQYHQN